MTETWSAAVFAVSSISMILFNKAAIICFPYADLLLIFQTVVTLILIWFLKGKTSRSFRASTAMQWAPCSFLFVLNLFTSLCSLQKLGVHTFTLIRNVQPVLVAPLELIAFKQHLSWSSSAFLFVIIFGSGLYAYQDLTFNLEGYAWGMLHIFSMSAYLIRSKQLANSLRLPCEVMSFYNNLLALPMFICMLIVKSYIFRGTSSDPLEMFIDFQRISMSCMICLTFSCIGGFCVSISAFQAQQTLSATSFVTLNNVSKIPAIILGRLIFGGSLSNTMLLGMGISLLGGYLYAMSMKSSMSCTKILKSLFANRWAPWMLCCTLFLSSVTQMFPPMIAHVDIEASRKHSDLDRSFSEGNKIIASYPDCEKRRSHICQRSSQLYVCSSVPGALLYEFKTASAHHSCLGGKLSWGTCSGGQFLCVCRGLSQQSAAWASPCPDTALERSDPRLANFSNSDYRLGNILDRWFSAYVCRNSNICTDEVTQKLMDEMTVLTARSPLTSFGRYLSENPPQNLSSLLSRVNTDSEFARRCSWFWIYFYTAIEEVLHEFRDAASSILRSYIQEQGIIIPYFNVHTCVVHYRLGDMLSHAHFLDPTDFAHELKAWSLNQSLDIHHFHILFSGNINFRANSVQAAASNRLMKTFLANLTALFPSSTFFLDQGGNPDEDWVKMVVAPMLFTSHGSYSVSAAAVSYGIRATPAMENSNFPGCESGIPRVLAKDWFLFPCRNFVKPA
jgi:hypothetical protein